MTDKKHTSRIIEELKNVGMTSYGLLKMETAKLPHIMHEDEHIGGVVYGHTTGDKIGSAMLVATDKRVLFIDVKPFFTASDEVSYDVVSGIKHNHVGPFAGVVLHTRVRDYGMRFVNNKCADTFVKFIEKHIEHRAKENRLAETQPMPNQKSIDGSTADEQLKYIQTHDTAVLSTIDREGNAHGAIIHYVFDNGIFYFMTKTQTAKAQNIALHGQVALTINESGSLKLVQVSGVAQQELNKKIVSKIYAQIIKPRAYREGTHLPPVATIKKGEAVVIAITPFHLHYHDFSLANW